MQYFVVSDGVDVRSSLIYMWKIHDFSGAVVGRYVGKSKNGEKRPRGHYKRNVDKLLKGLPYRAGNPHGYRRVHHALAQATRAGHIISVTYLRNVQPHENINQVEMHYIRQYGCDAENGIGLNGRSRAGKPSAIELKQAATPAPSEHRASTLNQIKDFIEKNFQHLLPKQLSHGYAFYVDNTRILRFSQSGPTAKVRLKLAISSRSRGREIESAWTGTDIELKLLIDSELLLYREHYA